MKSERQSRGLEVRAAEKEDKRSKYNMGYVSSTDVPEHIKKEGFDYYWERTSLRGQTDSSLDAALRRGWIPVPIDRDPDRFCDILERNPLSRKFICQGDVILLEREKVMTDQERQTNDKVSMERLTSSPAYNYRDPMKHTIGTVR
jgi:hypothetical protein